MKNSRLLIMICAAFLLNMTPGWCDSAIFQISVTIPEHVQTPFVTAQPGTMPLIQLAQNNTPKMFQDDLVVRDGSMVTVRSVVVL